MEVRRARLQDAMLIARIHVRSWQSVYQGLVPQDYLDGLDPAVRVARWAEALAQTDWARGGTLVIADDVGQPAGFANGGPSRDEDAGHDVGEIWAIYLSPDSWGQGLGRELMTVMLEYLAKAGYGQVTLWVLDSNVRGRRFYAAAGFRPDGAVKVDDSRGFALREVRYRRELP